MQKKVAVWGSVHLSCTNKGLSLQGIQAYLLQKASNFCQPPNKNQYRYVDACQWIINN